MDAENGKEADYENGFHRPEVNGTFNCSLQIDKLSETFENVVKVNNNVTSGSELKEEPSFPSEIHKTRLMKDLGVKVPGDSKKSKPLKCTGKINNERPLGSRHGAVAGMSKEVLKSSSNGTTSRVCGPGEDVDVKEKSKSFKKKQETDRSKAAGEPNN